VTLKFAPRSTPSTQGIPTAQLYPLAKNNDDAFSDALAYLLFHDAFHYGVATAIREAVEANPALVDCGYPCRTANVYADPVTPYNGFRLLRWTAAPVAPRSVDVEQVLDPIYAEHKRPRPPYRTDMLNHDIWYCRAVSPCEYCRTKQAAGNGA